MESSTPAPGLVPATKPNGTRVYVPPPPMGLTSLPTMGRVLPRVKYSVPEKGGKRKTRKSRKSHRKGRKSHRSRKH